MKVVIASDSYKGCMTSSQACDRIEAGILHANPAHTCVKYPMADGGEGTATVFCDVIHGKMVTCQTVDAYGKSIHAHYAYNGSIAVMDVASCIGLNMTPKEKRNPMVASSYGVGLMIKDAIHRGAKKLVIGLGGSGTNDGGMGILRAFGVKFYDKKRKELEPGIYSLKKIAFMDKRQFKKPSIEIIVACDVKNHLLGPEGATYIFGAQKGIFTNQMKDIDHWMALYRDKVQQTFHVDMDVYEGSGAAGGIGGVLLGVFHARQQAGISLLMETNHMAKDIQDCDLVITGEGQTDAQTMYGKVPYGVCELANQYGKPVICLSGALGKGYQDVYQTGMIGIFSTADRAMSFHQALAQGPEKLEALAYSITKLVDGLRK